MTGCELLKCRFWNGTLCTDIDEYINQDGEPVCRFQLGAIKEETSRRCENCDRYFDIETMHFDEDNIGLCEECYNDLNND